MNLFLALWLTLNSVLIIGGILFKIFNEKWSQSTTGQESFNDYGTISIFVGCASQAFWVMFFLKSIGVFFK